MGNINTRNADIEFKMSANGKSEVKKFTFTFSVRGGVVVDDYHSALFKFLMGKISSLPEDGGSTRPERKCTDYLITVQDKYGMMVRCHGEEEFVSALSDYHSWRRCLRIEAYGYALPRCSRMEPPRDERHPTVEASKASRNVEFESRRIHEDAPRRHYQMSGTVPDPPPATKAVTNSSSSPSNPFA